MGNSLSSVSAAEMFEMFEMRKKKPGAFVPLKRHFGKKNTEVEVFDFMPALLNDFQETHKVVKRE